MRRELLCCSCSFTFLYVRTGPIPMDMRYVRALLHDIWWTFLLVKYTVVMPLIPVNFWICRLYPPYFRFNLALVAWEAASEFCNHFTVSAASPSTQLSSRSILKCGDKEVSSTQLKNAARHVRYFILSPENLGIGIRRFLYTSFRDAPVIPTIHPVAFRFLSILPQLFISSALPGTILRLSRSNISRDVI